ncbi:hypothetical protein R4116_14350 [Listeria monocytogenes]|nr:hypothetical protein [Listeria monocytogenes]MDV7237587.1 hypothetical protein [Listeria monocytogenes]
MSWTAQQQAPDSRQANRPFIGGSSLRLSRSSPVSAIDLSNDSIYGLNTTVFSTGIDRAYGVDRQRRSRRAGYTAFRGTLALAFDRLTPSGIGRQSGREGIHAHAAAKTFILKEISTNSTYVSNSKEEDHS